MSWNCSKFITQVGIGLGGLGCSFLSSCTLEITEYDILGTEVLLCMCVLALFASRIGFLAEASMPLSSRYKDHKDHMKKAFSQEVRLLA